MKLVAAAGRIKLETQSDGIDLNAKKNIEVSSTSDSIHLHAAKEIVLHAGSTQVSLSDQGFLVLTGGVHLVHAGSHQLVGPQGVGGGFPPMPQSGPGELEVIRQYVNGSPVANAPFSVTDSTGKVVKGVLDGSGRSVVSGLAAGAVSVQHGADPNDPWDDSNYLNPPEWQPSDLPSQDSSGTGTT